MIVHDVFMRIIFFASDLCNGSLVQLAKKKSSLNDLSMNLIDLVHKPSWLIQWSDISSGRECEFSESALLYC